MRIDEVYADMDRTNKEDVKIILTLVCNNRKRTKLWVVVDQLPHTKERSYFEWKRFEDSITDDRRLQAVFEDKTPQWVRKNFPEARMSYRALRKLLREQEDNI